MQERRVPSAKQTLAGVTCATVRTCMAVGSYSGGTLAERWSGSSWATLPSPNPPGSTNAFENGVACPLVTNCWAVGWWWTTPASGTKVLIEHWNGRAWTVAAS